ncbi:Zinc transporter 9 [Seminavis robusta]|uniref:Zinc transporter 9 n=1 Tax=Seminavis robusta TaxID=568900 RepID=A0A9N8ERH2_9STRA|nr:Zinc transporter 9 [Seminavis robusta]|eukprot:Sro1501_g277930.1 Zinc transporter 9 (562) ;mRNA; f:18995-20680
MRSGFAMAGSVRFATASTATFRKSHPNRSTSSVLRLSWHNHRNPSLSLRFLSSPPSSSSWGSDQTNSNSHSNKTPRKSGSIPYKLQFSITPTRQGYKIDTLVSHQLRHFGDSSSSSSNSEEKEESLKKRRERLKRLTVVYPYSSEQDILRKQRKRKEAARKRTVANVNRALLGNVIIAGSKLFAWLTSQSSSMMSEFIHSCVDCANQYLLLQGLRDASNVADRKHPYGYGKSVYFWALVSALGTFFMGCGISMSHAWGELMNPSLHEIGPEVLGVLAFSFAVDGYVLFKTIREVQDERPKNGTSFWSHVKAMRDPATLAILLEDGAACFGVLLAIAGTTCSHATGNPIYDGLAGCSISLLLGSMGLVLASVNYRFLLGQAVDKDITDNIEKILKSRKSIDAVSSVQSQWTGPDTFSYKAEVDFDGTFLAAKLMPTHEREFLNIRGENMKKELPLVLSWYAEDVIRTVEQEVRIIEHQVRKRYPAAEYIELEPMSKDSHEFAIDGQFEKDLRRAEIENLEKLRELIPALDNIDAESRPSGAPTAPDDVVGSSSTGSTTEKTK